MKKTVFLFCAAALTALASVSCERSVPAEEPFHTVTIELGADNLTKTSVVEGEELATFLWDSEDSGRLTVTENGVEASSATLNISDDKRHATITATFATTSATEFVYAANLATNKIKDSNGKSIYGLSVPNAQNATVTSYDPDADALYAESETFTSRPKKINLTFKRPVVINKIEFSGLPAKSFESFVILGNKNILGYYVLSNGSCISSAKNISVQIDPTQPADGKLDVWFVSTPATSVTLTLKLAATDGTLYEKTLSQAVNLVKDQVTVLGVNMANVEPLPDYSGTYYMTNNMVEYICENWDTWQYPNTDKRWFKGKAIAYDADSDIITYDPAAVTISRAAFTFTRVNSGKYAGMYTISNGNWYMMKYAGSSPHDPVPWITCSTSLMKNNDLSYWDVTPKSNGTWRIQASLYDDPSYALFVFISESSSGLGYPVFMATHNISDNVKLFTADKVQPKS